MAEANSKSFPSKTDLNWIKYGLQGGESLSEEVVPDFSQNLNAIFTYTRARRWEGRKKEKNSSLLIGEARRQLHLKCGVSKGLKLVARSFVPGITGSLSLAKVTRTCQDRNISTLTRSDTADGTTVVEVCEKDRKWHLARPEVQRDSGVRLES